MTVLSRQAMTDARRARRQVEGAPIRRWTDAQRAFIESPYRLTVWWGGNGIGKSVAVAELVRRALCSQLHWQRPGPKVVILAGNTLMQLGATLQYLWNSEFRAWLRPGVRYESGSLKGQRLLVFDIIAGPGAGSTLRCGSFTDVDNLAGPRADVVVTDEPLPQKAYDELWARLFGRNGRMYQTFTVTMTTAPKLDYLWQMVDNESLPWAGQIQTELTLENVTPRGGLIELPWYSPDELREAEEGLSERQRDIRMGRTRHPMSGGVEFKSWGPHLIGPCDVPPGTPLGVGIDHGSKPGAQRAVLVAVGGRGPQARVWVLDEYKGDGRTESEEDAAGILAMLVRNGFSLGDVDTWYGDRAHAGDRKGGAKSNLRLIWSMAAHLGYDTSRKGWREKLPVAFRRMRVPFKRESSVWDGVEALHRLMVGRAPRITMAPRCAALNHDLSTWDGNRRAPEKDGIDALRYIVVPMSEREER